MRFVLFGCIRDCWAELVQKFVPRSRVGIFRNEHTRYSPLDPKLCFGVFPTICVHSGPFGCLTKLVAKRTELVQKVRAPMSRWNFSQRTHPIHNIGPQTDVLVHFLLFGCIRDVRLPYETRCKTGRASAKVCATMSLRNLSQ